MFVEVTGEKLVGGRGFLLFGQNWATKWIISSDGGHYFINVS